MNKVKIRLPPVAKIEETSQLFLCNDERMKEK